MKKIAFVGQPSRDKTYLMMYLAKLLAADDQVLVVTKDQWFMPVLDSYEYNEAMLIAHKLTDDLRPSYCLMDIEALAIEAYDVVFYVSAIDRRAVETNGPLFNDPIEAIEKVYIFMNVLLDGKINEAYLCQRFAISKNSHNIRSLYLNDNDLAVNIENGYNERLDIRALSKAYKKLLIDMATYCSGHPIKRLKQCMRSAERSK